MPSRPSVSVCSVATVGELARVRVLAKTLESVDPAADLHAVLIDDVEGRIDPTGEPFEVIYPQQLPGRDFVELAVSLEPAALRSWCTAAACRHLLDRLGPARPLVFVDCARALFAELHPLAEAAQRDSVAVVPRMREPPPLLVARGRELFDPGCFALSYTERTIELVCHYQALIEAASGADADAGEAPLWLDQVAMLVPGASVLRDPGLAVGPWNLHERYIVLAGERPMVEGSPLRTLSWPELGGTEPAELGALRRRYEGALAECGDAELRQVPYGLHWPPSLPAPSEITLHELRICREAELPGFTPFSRRGAERLLSWLRSPAPQVPDGLVSRFWWRAYLARPDLQRAFPALREGVSTAFLDWVLAWGAREFQLPAGALDVDSHAEFSQMLSSASQT